MANSGISYPWPREAPVIVARAGTYDGDEVKAAMEAAVAAAGGWESIAPQGAPVFLKPNLMSAREPARAVTTHPSVIAAAAAGLVLRGYNVRAGDSPAGAFKGLARVWENTGAGAACAAAGVEVVSLEASGSVARPITSRFIKEVRIARACAEANVISLPKLKTHFLTFITGAVKNLLGQVPGLAKAEFHRLAPHPDDFAELLVDLLPAYAPAFTIVDGIIGLEGDGPASGNARPLGVLLASANPAAIDVVAARMLGFKPLEVPTVRLTLARGMTPPSPLIVFVNGARERDLAPADVAAPGSRWLKHIPRPLMKVAGRQFVIRPVVHNDKCTGCGRCVASCPVGACTMDGRVAYIAPGTCIQCLCCFETCADEAITLEPGRAAKLYYSYRDYRRRRRARRDDAERNTEAS